MCCSTTSSAVPDSRMRSSTRYTSVVMIGCEAEGQLVGDEQLRLGHEHPGQGEHALLATRQRAGRLLASVASRGNRS